MIFNSNEGGKKKGKIKRDDFIFKCDGFFFFIFFFFYLFIFFFNSNEDSGAKFWVHFKMKPKF